MYDYIVVGAGYAGAICARRIAEELNKKVLLVEKRNHIAGNMYDFYNTDGILVHKYGPHISVMNEKKSFDFLSRFTEWIPYHHTVMAEIDGIEVPLPFNLTSIDLLFDVEKAIQLKEKLIQEYGFGANIPILELRKSDDEQIKQLSDFIYEKVFVHYTMKMWGLTPNEIDPSVTARIPVRLSYDNKHFLHKYQVMPKHGFTSLFEKMLDHPNITIKKNTNILDILELSNGEIYLNKELFNGELIYTGALDELFGYEYGILPYRALEFEFETYNKDYIQNSTTLNWPDDRPATRRTEMKRLTGQKMEGKTSTITEFPGEYKKDAEKFNEPYYPIINEECIELYQKYVEKLKHYKQIIIVGRLADYKYYNMEATILRALEVSEKIINTTTIR